MPLNPIPNSKPREWSVREIRDLVQAKFNKRACWFQVKVAMALYAGRDVVACAPTGAGKTLSFWIPLLMAIEDGLVDKMTIVVTPLNLLGKQNVNSLANAGISAIAVDKTNASLKTFKDIEESKYQVVSINPEILMANADVQDLWKKPKVTKRLLNFIFDEGQCISQWGSFRNEYLHLGSLRYLIPEAVPFYVPSATLPPAVVLDIRQILHLRPDCTEHIMCSNDRPEIALAIRGLTFPANSFRDLAFIIPEGFHEGDPPPEKFLIFFNSKKEAEDASLYLQSRLPKALRMKIKWFHAVNTPEYREEEVELLKKDETWGYCCTDSFGMGMDLPDIKLIVQYKADCDMSTLWQRFGRAARGPGQKATAVLFVEKKDLDEERALKAQRETRRKEKVKEAIGMKRKAAHQVNTQPKRRALADGTSTVNREDNDNGAVQGEVEVLKEERRQHYARRDRPAPIFRGKGKGRGGVEIGGAMDDFINAHRDFKCRRVVPMLFFGNDKALKDVHLLCDPDSSGSGCTRCQPRLSTVCCDLCNPQSFTFLDPPTSLSAKTRLPQKSNIKPFPMMTVDKALKTALFDWRDRTAPLEFRPSILKTLGSKVFISDRIISRIVDCAHAGKITTTAELIKETGWRKKWADDHGESLLAVVHVYHPTTPLTSSNSTTTDMPGLPRKRAPQKCGACGELGHISSNRNCPQKVGSRVRAFDTMHAGTSTPDENTPPTHPAPVTIDHPCQMPFFPNPYPYPHAAGIPIDYQQQFPQNAMDYQHQFPQNAMQPYFHPTVYYFSPPYQPPYQPPPRPNQ